MRYEYIHKIENNFSEEERSILDKAVALTNSYSEYSIVDQIAQFIQEISGAEFVLAGQLNTLNTIQTVSLIRNGVKMDNFTYDLKGTPCNKSIHFGICYYPYNIQQLFPEDELLQTLNIDSYLGTPLINDLGERIGIVALLDSKTINNAFLIENVITILSPRLETELMKLRTTAVA